MVNLSLYGFKTTMYIKDRAYFCKEVPDLTLLVNEAKFRLTKTEISSYTTTFSFDLHLAFEIFADTRTIDEPKFRRFFILNEGLQFVGQNSRISQLLAKFGSHFAFAQHCTLSALLYCLVREYCD